MRLQQLLPHLRPRGLNATCSVAGGLYTDTVRLGEYAAQGVRFGGIAQQSRNFDQFRHIDGIFGLAYFGTAGNPIGFDDSPFARLVEQNAGLENAFATCLLPEGGLLVLGREALDDRFFLGTLRWAPVIAESWYTVLADDLLVDGTSLGIRGAALNGNIHDGDGPCIVDSGTNFLSLTEPAFAAVAAALRARCPVPDCGGLLQGAAVAMTAAERQRFPTITLTLHGTDGPIPLDLGPEQYLIPQNGRYLLGVSGAGCIVGDTHMLKYWVVYDRAHSRIGFAPQRPGACAAPHAVYV